MWSFVLKILLVVYAAKLGQCQMIPALDVFLARLFDVTTNEIGNIVKGFDFHEVSPNDVDFVLYKPDKDSVVFKYKNTSMFDPLKPTKFMIHGWQASGKDDANKQLAEKYHQHGDYNTIALDWSKHAKKVYMHSSSSTKDIGKAVGDFIVEMTKNNAKLLDNVHLIGHSLGGHVAGFAGQRVYEKTGKKVGRITGLDVAAPLFEIPTKRSADSRLSEDDAQFVDVIHTNAGFLGVSEPIGTADFYVENGGPIQSECIDPLNIFESLYCSHGKAHEYYMESVGGKKYEAVSCRNSIDYHILACNGNKKVVMGENVPRDAKGSYYLETGSPLPYSTLMKNNPLRNLPKLKLPFVN